MVQHSRAYNTVISLMLLGATLLCLIACDRTPDKPAPASLVSTTSKGDPGVQVKELTDASNPYREQYRKWDEWTYYRALACQAERGAGNNQGNLSRMQGVIDEEGFLIPYLERVRCEAEVRMNGTQTVCLSNSSFIYGHGVMDPGLKAERNEAAQHIKAEYYPAIPDWLAADPPQEAVLLPNGDVITHGQINADAQLVSAGDVSSWDGYFRYNSDGDLISSSVECVWFWQLYNDPMIGGMPEGRISNRTDGYILFTDPLSDMILSIYDYDGTRLNTTSPPPPRDLHNFTWIPGERILKYHAYQNAIVLDRGDLRQ